MVRQNIIFNTLLIVCGGLFALVLEKVALYALKDDVSFFPAHFSPSQEFQDKTDDNKPRVFTHDGESLKRVHGFCEMLPPMDCAMMDTTSGEMPVFIHSTKSSGVSGAIVQKRGHEPFIMKTIQRELEKYPDAGFVDIGTNIGPFSLQAGRLGRSVVSVDAVIDNIQRLCKSVERNNLSGRVTMVINPMSDHHTSVSLEKGPSPTFEMTKVSGNVGTQNRCGDAPMMKTVVMDDLLSLVSFKMAVVKVDVEGFEYYVINGGQNFLKTIDVPSIIMEWRHVMKTKGRELIDILTGLSYEAHSFEGGVYGRLTNPDYRSWPINIIWLKKKSHSAVIQE